MFSSGTSKGQNPSKNWLTQALLKMTIKTDALKQKNRENTYSIQQ